jgi:phosphatidate cytidylyltransferase
MTPAEQISFLFIGAVCALVFASLFGLYLTRRYGSSESIANFNSRTEAWWIMVLVLGAAFASGKVGTIILFAFVSALALYEFLLLTDIRRSDHMALIASFLLVLPLQYYFVWIEWYGLLSIFIPVYGFLLLPILVALQGDTKMFMSRIAELHWGLMIAVFCLSHIPALITITISGYRGRNILLIAFLIIVVESSDVLQYIWGKLVGQRKIAPSLSPSKTLEGLVGGIGSATLIGAACYGITPFSMGQAALIALVVNVMGFLGGLVLSAIKRDRGVKDWGRIIPGHGGVLDRLDSIAFAGPIYFHIIRFWWGI